MLSPIEQTGPIRLARLEFVFRNVYGALETLGLNGAERQHTVRLAMAPWFLADDNGAFLYDATEVPASIIFNLEPNKMGSYTKFDVVI